MKTPEASLTGMSSAMTGRPRGNQKPKGLDGWALLWFSKMQSLTTTVVEGKTIGQIKTCESARKLLPVKSRPASGVRNYRLNRVVCTRTPDIRPRDRIRNGQDFWYPTFEPYVGGPFALSFVG
ncbi:hypothetical protein K443DRAFT_414068 [Laccaria amethystina LaAM-08-1]|uniref:Uncharacterized protein n=1 Tax=Laccaria amethystina LaAM-08-1 TaxID=1095629 RepID=A0A0C9X9M4_9AGAR|nr:hypothetical protein K443DRAFT_414068 [Laccaria amethystina LaAM-08-1]